MIQALVVSNIVLWLVVVVMGFVILALVRQIGVLVERVAPAGALAVQEGAQVGDAAPRLAVESLAGKRLEIGAPRDDERSTLLFFLSPDCPVCESILPALRSLARHEASRLDVVLASDGKRGDHEAFVDAQGLGELPYLLSTELGIAYGVSKLPFAALIDAAGTLRSRGLVNNREHLESLLEAMDLGIGSIQEWAELEARGELRIHR